MELDQRRIVTGYRRTADRAVHRMDAPLTTDLLGTELIHYARIDGSIHTSASVRALARLLGRVTLNPLALAEALAFGMVLRDETVVVEVRSIPAHSTLHRDGRIETHDGPRSTATITDGAVAARRMRGLL